MPNIGIALVLLIVGALGGVAALCVLVELLDKWHLHQAVQDAKKRAAPGTFEIPELGVQYKVVKLYTRMVRHGNTDHRITPRAGETLTLMAVGLGGVGSSSKICEPTTGSCVLKINAATVFEADVELFAGNIISLALVHPITEEDDVQWNGPPGTYARLVLFSKQELGH